jgi:membrane-associated protein
VQEVEEFFRVIMNSEKLIHYGGLTLLTVIIFLETGVFFGFFLPGDYLLFSAGLLCGTKDLNVNIFMLLCCVTFAAIAGYFAGYASGRMAGQRLFTRENSFFFRKSHLEKAKVFFNKYGAQSLIAGRFLPIIRTFAPIMAGASHLNLKKFSVFNVASAFLWVWTLIPIGYFLGTKYPQVIDYMEFIILGFLVITTAAVLWEYVKARRMKNISK